MIGANRGFRSDFDNGTVCLEVAVATMAATNSAPAPDNDVVFGIVTIFFADRGFGFVQGEDGKTYHLRVSNRRHMITFGVKGRRQLKGDPQIKFGPPVYFDGDPTPGDRIMFKVVPAKRLGQRPNASPWGLAPDQDPPEDEFDDDEDEWAEP